MKRTQFYHLTLKIEKYLIILLEQWQFENKIQTQSQQHIRSNVLNESCSEMYFCLGSELKHSRRILTEAVISVSEKGLDFASIQSKTNKFELRTDFDKFHKRKRSY